MDKKEYDYPRIVQLIAPTKKQGLLYIYKNGEEVDVWVEEILYFALVEDYDEGIKKIYTFILPVTEQGEYLDIVSDDRQVVCWVEEDDLKKSSEELKEKYKELIERRFNFSKKIKNE